MKFQRFVAGALLSCGLAFGTACSTDPEITAPQEFIASASDFAGFTAWTETTPSRVGPDPSGIIGGAHEASDTNFRRWMYINQNAAVRSSNGQFPIGTIILKDMRRDSGGVFKSVAAMAMAKRGNGFNPEGEGWEWFVLATDGTISARGGKELMGGACNSCHGAGNDNVFTR